MRRALFVLAAIAAYAGCHKPETSDKGSASGAKIAAVVHEMEHGEAGIIDKSIEERPEAAQESRDAQIEVAEATARERAAYKKLIAKEIGIVDRRLTELNSEAARASGDVRAAKDRDVSAVRGFRARLEQHLRDVEHSTESEWPALKERIEDDLEEGRPPQVPKSFDKSYAI